MIAGTHGERLGVGWRCWGCGRDVRQWWSSASSQANQGLCHRAANYYVTRPFCPPVLHNLTTSIFHYLYIYYQLHCVLCRPASFLSTIREGEAFNFEDLWVLHSGQEIQHRQHYSDTLPDASVPGMLAQVTLNTQSGCHDKRLVRAWQRSWLCLLSLHWRRNFQKTPNITLWWRTIQDLIKRRWPVAYPPAYHLGGHPCGHLAKVGSKVFQCNLVRLWSFHLCV